MTAPALAFERVHFSYGADPILDGIDLEVLAGHVTALMGPSGCGKSTLLAIGAGLLEPASGRVLRTGRRTAIVFQDPRLLPWRTALANVAFALKADRLASAERRDRAMAALASVGLRGDDVRKYPRQLSGGMRQRVALARALVIEPDLLLLDEPFGALDRPLARQMQSLARDHVDRRRAAALVVTHDPREAADIAEHVAVLSPAPARVTSQRALPGHVASRTEAERAAAAGALTGDAERSPGADP
ncbi:ABC transporter ATP-binding protein [Tropicimonas isoalkanivorans]|uniref:NitT/TauT family transport system ATP-binding protein n=1 Tax=Tropicimonas isoalkanivorans TaxID=441112 RepID=A0A1I1H458_9RHOB|nr:ATP-binding cassette domain-containing protein [Tropicimonas isoalkanivorans]SFC18591.1 NitT/TauT family transport system ATP-binding protein [Tropicimonas isoalkanivorans]